jgi:hypothetical protein
MQQMLVARRDTATIDDVIPVGDSFDYIVTGRDALDSQAAALFRSAATLYQEKLRPLLLAAHGLSDSQCGGRAEDRIPMLPRLACRNRLGGHLVLFNAAHCLTRCAVGWGALE